MEEILSKLHKRFPSLSPPSLLKIYKARAERMRMLMIKGIPDDIRWLIEANVRLLGELNEIPTSFMPGFGRSTYAKKRRTKRIGATCHRCARTTCNARCRSLGWVSDNREDKIKFIRDGLSKESLDNILETLETHPSGYVHRAILQLHTQFLRERQQLSHGILTKEDPVCQFKRKLDGSTSSTHKGRYSVSGF